MGSSKSKQPQDNTQDHQPRQSSLYHLDIKNSYSNDIDQSSITKLRTKSPLKMPTQQTFRCDQCGMIFPTDEALFKHRTRFCIGIQDSGKGRQLYYSDNDQINRYNNQSNLREIVKHQSPVDKKRNEINEWKNQRSILQSVQDMEDRILRDSQKTEKLANHLKQRTHDYNQILTEYEQLQTQERDLLRQMFNIQGQSGSNLNQPNSLTDHEKTQLEILQRQSIRVEQERQIIQNKLEQLIANNNQESPIITNYEPYKLLRDMKEQQDQNEKSLLYLQRRLAHPESLSDIPSLPYISPSRKIDDDDDNVRYLRLGSYDSHLERRLRQYEYYPWMKDYPEPLRHYRYRPTRSTETINNKLILTKNENQRLQNEVDDMQRKFQRLDSRTKQLELTLATNGIYDSKSNGFQNYSSSQINRYPPTNSLTHTSAYQNDSYSDNILFNQQRQYHQSSLPLINKPPTSSKSQPTNRFTTNISKLRDPFGPQPYDPIRGFVMFFDFILNFPPIIDQCRLISCLHHAQSGLGEPSQLEPFKCQSYIDETTGERMGIALIATKQPVPSCPPEQLLTIVIEIQITTKQSPNEPLRTNAWVKIPLFDHKNFLLSGRWKVPLLTLPIRHDENLNIISTLPTLGRAELHYRLVNSQDEIEQSNTPLSPTFKDLYFYPPQYRNRPYI